MKLRDYIILPFVVMAFAAVSSCSENGGSGPRDYDSEVCEQLAMKVERRDSLTQHDYAVMIHQNEEILKYIVAANQHVADLPQDERIAASRALKADPEYMQRFGFLFTLGSALYQAETRGWLDESNARAYTELDHYNESLARVSEKF